MARRVAAEIVKRHLSQEEAARQIGVSVRTVVNWILKARGNPKGTAPREGQKKRALEWLAR